VPERTIRPRVRDTLTGRKVRVAAPGKKLTLYVCGITPYDSGHIGHAFTFLMFDVLVRFLEANGVPVRYVQNVTDVDDPLFAKARYLGVNWRELADRETKVHLRDMQALGWRLPDVIPRVSQEIKPILAAAQKLHKAGFAYQTDALYFDTSKYRGFGRLSGLSRRSMLRKLRAEALLGTVGPNAKRDALDFPLWRASAPDEPAWPSKFGDGRPGWHIECSSMSMRYLGEQIDIHGGGRDLEFSHHESERAQSEALTGKAPFARAWMHTGLVRYQGHKMSKSLGNLVRVSQALEQAPAAAVRLYLVSHHYRRDWDFEWEGLARARQLIEKVRLLLHDRARNRSKAPPSGTLMAEFNAALADDLDTPRAVRTLRAALRQRDVAAVRWMLGILTGTASLS
jgi:L-cysteine:1D-myo-inositol 2-amino-2-deoxy-alpha-D-glucopyranoside ligase